MLLLGVIIEWKTWCCISTVTKNRKQQNTDNGLWIAEKFYIMFEIWHELGSFGPITDPKTVMSHWFGSE